MSQRFTPSEEASHAGQRQGQGRQEQTAEAAQTRPTGPSGTSTTQAGGPALTPWWQSIPGRLEAEFEALRQAGLPFTLREDEKRAGAIVLDVTVTVAGRHTVVIARYPETFPYMRPEVYAPALALPHHQNPFQKNLCLLGRRSDNWTPQMDLAELLSSQLPKVVAAANSDSRDEAADLEEHQGEPISAFYPFVDSSVCVVDGSWTIPDETTRGSVRIAFRVEPRGVRATAIELRNTDGRSFAKLSWQLSQDDLTVGEFRWVRLLAPIHADNADDYDRQLTQLMPHLGRRQYSQSVDLILVGYPEETGWRNETLGWLLLVRQKQVSKIRVLSDKKYLVRVTRAGANDFAARVPEVTTMRNAVIGIFGLGCVGAPIALELARAGVKELLVTDDDFVEAGTTVRWPLGIAYAGRDKIDALPEFIRHNYPFTAVRTFKHRLGTPPGMSPLRDRDVLPAVFDSADVVVDATAEFGVQRLLSDLALAAEIPYVGVHATHGGYGGEVLRLMKGRTGCWMCLALHRADGTIPTAPSKQGDWSQPEGCAAATFTGASWDLTESSLEAVRLIVGTVMGGEEDQDYDLAILSLRDQSGARTAPRWDTFAVPPHPNCADCPAR